MAGETIAARLARWVIGLRYEDLSPEVVFHARRCMLDVLGVQIRGATLPWVQPVYRYVRSLGGPTEATITYHGDRISTPYAAYANSTFSYSCELQHHGSLRSAHTGVIVVPTVQALGEKLGSTGRDAITAMVAGYEVQGRLGLALFEHALRRHFHPQGVLGVFSAAATAGKLLGLDEEQLVHAFGIAGSHASTILEYDQAGGEVKRTHGAIALRNGMQSAFLAKEGFTGPPSVFEGRRGIFAAFGGGEPDPELVLSDLGHPYCITRCRFRIYPTVGGLHTTLDVLDRMATEHSFDYQEVEGIKLEDADVIVSGGRGIGGPEGFEGLAELAKLLKAAVGASRPPCDSGWVPDTMQVGLTGKIVSPDLYIAVALSGSSQHLAGCGGSKNIVAINKDPEANIFKEASYGVVGDYKKIIPALTEKVKELLAG